MLLKRLAAVPLFSIILFLSLQNQGWAQDNSSRSQFHFRTGVVSGSFAGPVPSTLNAGTPMDIEYEMFRASRNSLIFRTLLDFDPKNSRVQYGYAGTGQRFYFFRDGMAFDVSDEKTSIKTNPGMRYYAGWDLGIANMVVKGYGPLLTASSWLIDLGAALGAIYQLSRGIGLEVQVGMSMGMGFSALPGNSSTTRILFGAAFYF